MLLCVSFSFLVLLCFVCMIVNFNNNIYTSTIKESVARVVINQLHTLSIQIKVVRITWVF